MPSLSSASDSRRSHTSTSTMSVAVLSPVQTAIHSQMPIYAAAAPSQQNGASKRPKLSLNTSTTTDSPYRSKQSTSLRIETLSATSPTARNTFGNAYARSFRRGKPASPMPVRRDSAGPDTPVDQAIVIASASPVSATYEVEPRAEIIPYTLDYDVNSILRNGPMERKRDRQSPTSQSKPIFSLTKRVIFRAPLTEEVKNKQYTLRHSDITTTTTTHAQSSASTAEVKKGSSHILALRQAPLADEEEEEEEEHGNGQEVTTEPEEDAMAICPATPVAGRGKTDRHWYWTLGTERFNDGHPIHASETIASPSELETAS